MNVNAIDVEVIKRFDIFRELVSDADSMNRLIGILTVAHYKKGTAIIRESERGDELYLLASGKVRIERKTTLGEKFTIVILPAEWNIVFGEQTMIGYDQRSATVVAEEDCSCYVMNRKDFETLGDSYPRIGLLVTRAIARKISADLRKTNEDRTTLVNALVAEIDLQA